MLVPKTIWDWLSSFVLKLFFFYTYKVTQHLTCRQIFHSMCLTQTEVFTLSHWKQFSCFQGGDYRNPIFSHANILSTTSSTSFGTFRLWHEKSEICLELQQWRESREKGGNFCWQHDFCRFQRTFLEKGKYLVYEFLAYCHNLQLQTRRTRLFSLLAWLQRTLR